MTSETPPADTFPPVTLEDGTPVPLSDAAAELCDCAVTRIAVDAIGVPLDLGRTQRLFTGEQRRAIIARDRECIWPGCHLNARWCEIHHRIWWERDNGCTSVDDGVLLCTFHHHETHRLDLAIVRILGLPTGSPPGGRRRRLISPPQIGYEFRDPAGRLAVATDLPITPTRTDPPPALMGELVSREGTGGERWNATRASAPLGTRAESGRQHPTVGTGPSDARAGTGPPDAMARSEPPGGRAGSGPPDARTPSGRPGATSGSRRPHAASAAPASARGPTRTATPVS